MEILLVDKHNAVEEVRSLRECVAAYKAKIEESEFELEELRQSCEKFQEAAENSNLMLHSIKSIAMTPSKSSVDTEKYRGCSPEKDAMNMSTTEDTTMIDAKHMLLTTQLSSVRLRFRQEEKAKKHLTDELTACRLQLSTLESEMEKLKTSSSVEVLEIKNQYEKVTKNA